MTRREKSHNGDGELSHGGYMVIRLSDFRLGFSFCSFRVVGSKPRGFLRVLGVSDCSVRQRRLRDHVSPCPTRYACNHVLQIYCTCSLPATCGLRDLAILRTFQKPAAQKGARSVHGQPDARRAGPSIAPPPPRPELTSRVYWLQDHAGLRTANCELQTANCELQTSSTVPMTVCAVVRQ